MECGRKNKPRKWEEARRASAAMVVAGATDRRRNCECGQMGPEKLGDARWAGWIGAMGDGGDLS